MQGSLQNFVNSSCPPSLLGCVSSVLFSTRGNRGASVLPEVLKKEPTRVLGTKKGYDTIGVMTELKRWKLLPGEEQQQTKGIQDPPGYACKLRGRRTTLKADNGRMLDVAVFQRGEGSSKGSIREKGGASDGSLKQQKCWELAQSPFRGVLMQGFMMWMSGSSIQIFSIIITFTSISSPLKAILGSGKIFRPFKDGKVDVAGPRLLFCLIHFGGLLMGLWKLNKLGLLPTHVSDWIGAPEPPKALQFSSGAILT